MDAPDRPTVLCPHCGAGNGSVAYVCSSCGQSVILVIADEPSSADARSPGLRFGIGSLMLLIGALAVCLAMIREVPGLAVVLILVAVPALARTLGGVSRRSRAGRPTTTAEKVEMFAGSLAVVCAILITSAIAFVVSCLPTAAILMSFSEKLGFVIAVAAGLAVAGLPACFLIRNLWPMRDL